MNIKDFLNNLEKNKITRFFGVPDTLLYPLTSEVPKENLFIVPNEGNAVAMGFGFSISTGKLPVIFLQNSGIGNILDPLQSLVAPEVYNHPMLYIISWRGRPGTNDAPQHIRSGKDTEENLKLCKFDIYKRDYFESNTFDPIEEIIKKIRKDCRSAAILVDDLFFTEKSSPLMKNKDYSCILNKVSKYCDDEENIIITSTGMISREFSIYTTDEKKYTHLPMVGSLGETLSLASGIALGNKILRNRKKVIVIDGDGSLLMHLGALAIPDYYDLSLTYILLNNHRNLTVGGEHTLAKSMNFKKIAQYSGFGNTETYSIKEFLNLKKICESNSLKFIEIICSEESEDSILPRMTYGFENIKNKIAN
ncbi:thiamine pyrophosphate-dependent enzyme [Pseudolactococcus reticulitermitis]|uniref:Phosphonopyruvate decarboxylase n=1 Tax=Pseudolactococcus reticulitermitis TaxID=2025039 RepID=A0A224WX48_9LACT|nr:thiamine pyrophosphate-dependent enzyme [Lactococcus reticulitermitis]GAX46878.1 hypothetical protein RsY01_458 [Lactococcus reticulitermitis]